VLLVLTGGLVLAAVRRQRGAHRRPLTAYSRSKLV
jgi:hypothetical protein